jgi:hypothetical protein
MLQGANTTSTALTSLLGGFFLDRVRAIEVSSVRPEVVPPSGPRASITRAASSFSSYASKTNTSLRLRELASTITARLGELARQQAHTGAGEL